MEQCTRTLGLNVGIPLVVIRNWILVEYSGINRSLYLSLNYLDWVGIWVGTDEESRSRKNGEVSDVGKNLEIPRWYAPPGGTKIAARRRRRHCNQIWWNQCWRVGGLFWKELVQHGGISVGEIHGSRIVFLPWWWSRMLGMFYELTSSRKAWDVELIFLIWVFSNLVAWVHGTAWNKVLE